MKSCARANLCACQKIFFDQKTKKKKNSQKTVLDQIFFFLIFWQFFFDKCAHKCARAQAFIGRKLDRSSSISYQIIILEFFYPRNDGRTGYTLVIEGRLGLP